MLLSSILYQPPTIKIVPESDFKPWSINPAFDSIELNKGTWKDFIIISPCRHENYECPLLFKLKYYCEQNNIKLISFGSKNFFPLYAMYSDEVVLLKDSGNPSWYKGFDGSSNKIDASPIFDLPQYVEMTPEEMIRWRTPVPFKKTHKIALNASPEKIAQRFANAPIYVREESYRKFIEVKETLPRNVIVAEIKDNVPMGNMLLKKKDFEVIGLNHDWQIKLQNQVGKDNYLTCQILGSHTLNWSYICIGGSANLFSVVPIQTVFMLDWLLDVDQIKSFSQIRYGTSKLPIVLNKNQFLHDAHADWQEHSRVIRWGVKQFSKIHS